MESRKQKNSVLFIICRFISSFCSLFFAQIVVLMIEMFYGIATRYYDTSIIQNRLLTNFVIWCVLSTILGAMVHNIRFFIENEKIYIVRMPVLLIKYCIPTSSVKDVLYQYNYHYSMGTVSSHKRNDIKYYIVTSDNRCIESDRLFWNPQKITAINSSLKCQNLKIKKMKNSPKKIKKSLRSTMFTTTVCTESILVFLFCSAVFLLASNVW